MTPHIAAEILLCGRPHRGDDTAPTLIGEALRGSVSSDVVMRAVGRLDIDDLLGVPAGAGVVIVDAATGIRPGHIVELPLDGMIAREDRLRTRSSHALSFAEVLGLAYMIRGHKLRGRVVVIGASDFRPGHPLSDRVARALPAFAAAILRAIDSVRTLDAPVAAAGFVEARRE